MKCLITSPLPAAVLLAVALSACDRDRPASPPPAPAVAQPAVSQAPLPTAITLNDVVETTPDYIIGITYPPTAARYPGLAGELKTYADAVRAELLAAVAKRKAPEPGAPPYDLSLTFTELMATPELVAVAADGSSYTGGAHGNPLLQRFVWLPQPGKRLTAEMLVPNAAHWKPIADLVREQLHTALSQRLDADELPPEDRARMMREAGRMIDEGTDASAVNFRQFEPVLGTGNKLRALRFVFPPYQVGPYVDGVQTVELPAAALLPYLAPEYQGLFASE